MAPSLQIQVSGIHLLVRPIAGVGTPTRESAIEWGQLERQYAAIDTRRNTFTLHASVRLAYNSRARCSRVGWRP